MLANGTPTIWKWLTGILSLVILGLVGAWGKNQVDTDTRQATAIQVVEDRVSKIEKDIASQYAEINGKLTLLVEQSKRRRD